MIDVLIPNRFTWNSICLTIESIIARTNPKTEYRIIVCDNSEASNNLACEPHTREARNDDGNRRQYLRAMAAAGHITLIEVKEQAPRYGHGENLARLCDASTADLAMLFNANSEIIRPEWLDVLTGMLSNRDRDLGVARFRSGGAREHDFICPTYWPNMMLLDMRLYRKYFSDNRWELRQVGFEDWERPELFAGQYPKNPERTPPLVFADTGYTLWERLTFDNPDGLRMLPLPDSYWNTYIMWRGGIDRNSHRPDHDYVRQTLAEVDSRLAMLRSGR